MEEMKARWRKRKRDGENENEMEEMKREEGKRCGSRKRLGMLLSRLGRKLGRKGYLLMDGMNSCAYIPERTYRQMMKRLLKSLDRNPKGENSLRFLWTREPDGEYILAVNPRGTDMTCTHGLVRDNNGGILIPCPYVQRVYHKMGLEPEWCGKVYLEYVPGEEAWLCGMRLLAP